MLFQVRNDELIQGREKTYLTAAVSVGDTSITVRAVDTNAWADNDYIIIGEIGLGNAEVMQANGAVADGTSLTIDNNGSGGTRYAHSVNEPVYRIDYNRIEFGRATTDVDPTVTTPSVLATNEIQPDDLFTRFEDVTNTTGFGFVRFNNQTGSTFSEYSDGIAYTGYTPRSLGRLIKMVRRHLDEPDFRDIEDEDIIEEVNEKQRDIAHERLWPFYEDIFSDSRVAFQQRYDIDDDVVHSQVHTLVVESEPLAKIDQSRFDILQWDTATVGEPTKFAIWNNQIILHPNPDAAATTTAINDAGNMSAIATSVTVDSTSGFSPSGRMLIQSEVISYSNTTSTSFRGLVRGLEETTAATHADDIAITERDIIYTVHREPNELLEPGDETNIPDPSVLAYGVAMELALGKLRDQGMHDRMKLKYDEGMDKLRDKFGRKGTSQYFRIKDKEETVSDVGMFRDPNNFPIINQ